MCIHVAMAHVACPISNVISCVIPCRMGQWSLLHLALFVFRYWIRKRKFLITVRVGRIRRNPKILYDNLAYHGFNLSGTRAICWVEQGWLLRVMCELSDRGFLFSDWNLAVVQDLWASDFVEVVGHIRKKERIDYRLIGSFVVWRNALDTIID